MMNKIGRNDPCPCDSGEKYKRCCLAKDEAAQRIEREAFSAGLQKKVEQVQQLFATEQQRDELAEGMRAMGNLMRRGQFEQANRLGQDILIRQPGVHEGYDGLARDCIERGLPQQAIGWYEKCLELIRAEPDRYPPSAEKRYQHLIGMLGGNTEGSASAS